MWRSGRARRRRRRWCCPTRAGEAPSYGLVDFRLGNDRRTGEARPAPTPENRNTSGMSMTILQLVVSGVLLGALYAMFASGLTLIWGMMNVVNFAHGDFVMLAMYTAFVLWKTLGLGPAAAVPITALLMATVGIVVYFALVRHVMRGPMIAQILGTFGLALFLRYAVFWYFGANLLSLPDNLVGGTFDLR